MTSTASTTATPTPTVPGPDPVAANTLTFLAEAAGVSLPDFAPDLPGNDISIGADVPPAKVLTDAQIIRIFVTKSDRHPDQVPSEVADAAAARLGTTRLLKMGARMGARTRLRFIQTAFGAKWLPATIESFDALCEGLNRVDMLHEATGFTPDRLAATPSELTAWVAEGTSDDLAAVTRLWNSSACPAGIIDHDVITGLDLTGLPNGWHVQEPRLSAKSVAYVAAARPALAGFAVCYAAKTPSVATLVRYYDDARDAMVDVNTRTATWLVGPLVDAMRKAKRPTRDSLARCKAYLLTDSRETATSALGHFVAVNCVLSDDELFSLVRTPDCMARWLSGDYTKNQPTEALTGAILADAHASMCPSDVVFHVEDRRARQCPINHPERLQWLITPLRADRRAPQLLRLFLVGSSISTPKPTKGDSAIGVLVQAAAAAFAEAPEHVQTRLWRALVTNPSLFTPRSRYDREAPTFDAATTTFIERDAEAAARVAAKAAKATK